jgi:hypothetical protein
VLKKPPIIRAISLFFIKFKDFKPSI